MWWPLHHDGRSRKKNKWRWRIRCGDPCIVTGEAERRTNVDGESDVVTTASWREKPKEEQMEMENPMWWPLHRDGRSRKRNKWRWRIRCGDHCIVTGEAERRTNGDGESDVVTTASWREKPKEEQMEMDNPMWWPLHPDGRSRKKNKWSWRIRCGDNASWLERPKEEQMEMENPMWWPLHHDGRGRKKNKWSWRIRCGDPCIMTGEAERRTNGDGESDVVTTASWREKPKEEQMEMENPMWWPLHHDGRSRKKNKWSWRIRCGDPCIMTGEAERRTNGDGESDAVTTASWREKPKEEQMEMENPMWWPLLRDGRSRKKKKWRWRIRCGDHCIMTGEAERRKMEMENPMWWPLHRDGRSLKKKKWRWRIRCGDHCIITGEAERRRNGDGESDVVTTASWRERPKEEQL